MRPDDCSQKPINERYFGGCKRKLSTYQSLDDVRTIPVLKSIEELRKTQEILKTKILPRFHRQSSIEQNSLSTIQTVRPHLIQLVANDIDSNLTEIIPNNHIPYSSLSQSFYPKTKLPSLKPKSRLTFHQYKGPLQKVETTKLLLESTDKPLDQHYDIEQPQSVKKIKLVEDQKSTIPTTRDFSSTDEELYQEQQRKLIELEKQLEKLQENETSIVNQISSKCHPIRAVQLQKRILQGEQEKLKQKLQQNRIVSSTSESLPHNTFLNLFDENFNSNYPPPCIDWMAIPSPLFNNDYPDFLEFLDQFDPTSQSYNSFSSDLFSLDMY